MEQKEEHHVVFGTGPVGIATAQVLLTRKKAVTVVNRSGQLPRAFAGTAVRVKTCDLLDAAQVANIAEGATHLYHCANLLYHQWKEILPSIQANLVEAAVKNKSVLTLSENLYMYDGGVEKINEDTSIRPPTRKGKIRQDLSAALEKGLDWVSIRASDYYGPWATYQSAFGTDRFLDVLRKGKSPSLLGNPLILHSYTYIGDFGEALVQAALKPSSHGRAWICPNAPAVSSEAIGKLFVKFWDGKDLSRVRFKALPRMMVHLAGIFSPMIRELVEMLYQKEEPYVVDGSGFEKELGMIATSLEEGVRQTLKWYEDKG